jgi:hypothetical protein
VDPLTFTIILSLFNPYINITSQSFLSLIIIVVIVVVVVVVVVVVIYNLYS